MPLYKPSCNTNDMPSAALRRSNTGSRWRNNSFIIANQLYFIFVFFLLHSQPFIITYVLAEFSPADTFQLDPRCSADFSRTLCPSYAYSHNTYTFDRTVDPTSCIHLGVCPQCFVGDDWAEKLADLGLGTSIERTLAPWVLSRNWLTHEIVTTLTMILLREALGYKDAKAMPTLGAGNQDFICCGADEVMIDMERWNNGVQLTDEGYFSVYTNPVGYSGTSGIYMPHYTLDKFPMANAYNAYKFLPEYSNIFAKAMSTNCSDMLQVKTEANMANCSLNSSPLVCDTNFWSNTHCVEGHYIPPQCQGSNIRYCQELYMADPLYDRGIFEGIIKNNNLNFTLAYIGDAAYSAFIKAKYASRENFLFYWYTPDPLTAAVGARAINFDPVTGDCTKKRSTDPTLSQASCGYPVTTLLKYARRDVLKRDADFKFFFESFSLTDQQINNLLSSHYAGSGNQSVFELTCSWLQDNMATWAPWIQHTPPFVPQPIPKEATIMQVWVVAVPVAAVALIALTGLASMIALRRLANRHAPKSGPLAILFTDVESSTTLWELCGNDMKQAMRVHNEVIRKLISEYQAYEVKTNGDSFMIACKSLTDATLLSLAIQTALNDREDIPNSITETYETLHANDVAKNGFARMDVVAGETGVLLQQTRYPTISWAQSTTTVGPIKGTISIAGVTNQGAFYNNTAMSHLQQANFSNYNHNNYNTNGAIKREEERQSLLLAAEPPAELPTNKLIIEDGARWTPPLNTAVPPPSSYRNPLNPLIPLAVSHSQSTSNNNGAFSMFSTSTGGGGHNGNSPMKQEMVVLAAHPGLQLNHPSGGMTSPNRRVVGQGSLASPISGPALQAPSEQMAPFTLSPNRIRRAAPEVVVPGSEQIQLPSLANPSRMQCRTSPMHVSQSVTITPTNNIIDYGRAQQTLSPLRIRGAIGSGTGSGPSLSGQPSVHAPSVTSSNAKLMNLAATSGRQWNGLRVRIGLQYCTEVAPTLDKITQRYDYFGHHVNVAARVEGYAYGGQVVVQGDTFEQLMGSEEFHELISPDCVVTKVAEEAELKGVHKKVPLYSLLPLALEGRRFKPLANVVLPSAAATQVADVVVGGGGEQPENSNTNSGGDGGEVENPAMPKTANISTAVRVNKILNNLSQNDNSLVREGISMNANTPSHNISAVVVTDNSANSNYDCAQANTENAQNRFSANQNTAAVRINIMGDKRSDVAPSTNPVTKMLMNMNLDQNMLTSSPSFHRDDCVSTRSLSSRSRHSSVISKQQNSTNTANFSEGMQAVRFAVAIANTGFANDADRKKWLSHLAGKYGIGTQNATNLGRLATMLNNAVVAHYVAVQEVRRASVIADVREQEQQARNDSVYWRRCDGGELYDEQSSCTSPLKSLPYQFHIY